MANKVIGFNFKSEKHKRAAAILLDMGFDEIEQAEDGVDFETNSQIAKTLATHEAIDALCDPVIVETQSFESELISLINKYSKENASNTPDYVLSAFLAGCLKSWEMATKERDKHHGVNFDPENSESITLINK